MPRTITAPAALSVLDSVPESEKADALRIDVVLPDQPQHGVGRHRVDVLVAARHTRKLRPTTPGSCPRVARPLTPILEVVRETVGRTSSSR